MKTTFAALLLGMTVFPSLAASLPTLYDYRLTTPQGEALGIDQITQKLHDADVILVGEWHGHAGVHLFQAKLFSSLAGTYPGVSLSMEQFSRDRQELINEYLKGKIGEQALISKGNAWNNYPSDYRPLVEIAKAAKLDVIAANAPKSVVRCIGQQGLAYLEKLTPKERGFVAKHVDTTESAYKTRFMASMHHGSKDQSEKQFAAQVTWDETMAESIVRQARKEPGGKVFHIAGRFHVSEGLGIAARIHRLDPSLNIVMITPETKDSPLPATSPDYRLEVLPPPEQYISHDEMRGAIKAMRPHSGKYTCHK
ncbi:ChaN family lipoprotein [Parasalinivibrio latis]